MQLPAPEVFLSWPTPNYKNPKTRGDALVIVNSIFIGFTVIIVFLRLYTRLVIKRWLGIDDIFILLALVSSLIVQGHGMFSDYSTVDFYDWSNCYCSSCKSRVRLG